MQFMLDLPIREVRNFSVPPIRAHVKAQRVKGTGPFIVRLKGTVLNTGSLPWLNDNNQTPFRVGAIVFAADGQSAPFMELRYDLPVARVEVGQEVPFCFTFDIGELPIGEYYVHVDVLRERCFWFTQLGSVGDSIRLDVLERRKERTNENEHALNPPNSWARSAAEASVLYIAPTLPLYDTSTGGRRLLDMFRILRGEGVHVTFLYEQLGLFGDASKYIRKLDELGVEHFSDPLGFLSELKDSDRFNLVILGWHSTARAMMATVRDVLPQVRVAVDSVDIQWGREARAMQRGPVPKSLEELELEKAKERRAYTLADEVWVVSEEEAEILAQELPAVKWRVVGVPCNKSDAYVQDLKGERALFVGGFAHPPNESTAVWAAQILRELNTRTGKSVALDIVGAQPPASVRELGSKPNVRVHGFVQSLDDCHRQAKIFFAPLTYGGGVKGKICDAICRGIPVITNSVGNEGLGLKHGEEILLGETTEDFVKLLDDVYAGRYDLELLRKNAVRKVQSLYGDDVIKAQILSAITPPHVVIGIVTYNQRELLRVCLKSVLAKTSYQSFTIAVISNGCSDGTQEMLRELAEIYPHLMQVHCSDTNNYFVRPCNQIIDQYPQSDIVLMNNDVEVINPGWLTNLVDAAYSSRLVCGSGGLVFDSEGMVSEAGAEIYSSGLGRNLYRGSALAGGAALAIRSVGFVSGCLMYMRRDAIQAIGGLDDEYHPMYFEDVAWHYTAHCHGLKTLYTPWSRIIHKEGSSAGKEVSSGMKRYQEINRRKFLEKFRGVDFEQFNYGR
jgi:GT2 family glycosyltransferase